MKKFLAISAAALLASTAFATAFMPPEVGTTVNGYQDTFDTLSADWTSVNVAGAVNTPGILTIDGTGGDAHLYYNGATYDSVDQEVLALVRPVGVWGPAGADAIRGGVCVNGDGTQAHNLLLREKDSDQVAMLDDGRAWGPKNVSGVVVEMDTWYWLRFKSTGSQLLAKAWVASDAEPVDWTTWDRGGRSGLAGLTAASAGDVSSTLEVDYFLLKSPGLPAITVAPEPASLMLLALAGLMIRRR